MVTLPPSVLLFLDSALHRLFFVDDLWPKLTENLNLYSQFDELSDSSMRGAHLNQFSFTGSDSMPSNRHQIVVASAPSFKVQLASLAVLARLIEFCDLPRKYLQLIARNMWFYLSSDQPKDLQAAAVALFETLLKRDSDFSWLILRDLSVDFSSIATVPSKDFLAVDTRDFVLHMRVGDRCAYNAKSPLRAFR